MYAGKSASQEFLSPLKEEKEEKKAQSMDNLDGNCKLEIVEANIIILSDFVSLHISK